MCDCPVCDGNWDHAWRLLTGHRTRGDNANLVVDLTDLSHWILMPVSVRDFIRQQDGTNGLYCGRGDVYVCEVRM